MTWTFNCKQYLSFCARLFFAVLAKIIVAMSSASGLRQLPCLPLLLWRVSVCAWLCVFVQVNWLLMTLIWVMPVMKHTACVVNWTPCSYTLLHINVHLCFAILDTVPFTLEFWRMCLIFKSDFNMFRGKKKKCSKLVVSFITHITEICLHSHHYHNTFFKAFLLWCWPHEQCKKMVRFFSYL